MTTNPAKKRYNELVAVHKCLYELLQDVTIKLLTPLDNTPRMAIWTPLLMPVFANNNSVVVGYEFGWINVEKTVIIGRIKCNLGTESKPSLDTIFPADLELVVGSMGKEYKHTFTPTQFHNTDQLTWLLYKIYDFNGIYGAKQSVLGEENNSTETIYVPYTSQMGKFINDMNLTGLLVEWVNSSTSDAGKERLEGNILEEYCKMFFKSVVIEAKSQPVDDMYFANSHCLIISAVEHNLGGFLLEARVSNKSRENGFTVAWTNDLSGYNNLHSWCIEFCKKYPHLTFIDMCNDTNNFVVSVNDQSVFIDTVQKLRFSDHITRETMTPASYIDIYSDGKHPVYENGFTGNETTNSNMTKALIVSKDNMECAVVIDAACEHTEYLRKFCVNLATVYNLTVRDRDETTHVDVPGIMELCDTTLAKNKQVIKALQQEVVYKQAIDDSLKTAFTVYGTELYIAEHYVNLLEADSIEVCPINMCLGVDRIVKWPAGWDVKPDIVLVVGQPNNDYYTVIAQSSIHKYIELLVNAKLIQKCFPNITKFTDSVVQKNGTFTDVLKVTNSIPDPRSNIFIPIQPNPVFADRPQRAMDLIKEIDINKGIGKSELLLLRGKEQYMFGGAMLSGVKGGFNRKDMLIFSSETDVEKLSDPGELSKDVQDAIVDHITSVSNEILSKVDPIHRFDVTGPLSTINPRYLTSHKIDKRLGEFGIDTAEASTTDKTTFTPWSVEFEGEILNCTLLPKDSLGYTAILPDLDDSLEDCPIGSGLKVTMGDLRFPPDSAFESTLEPSRNLSQGAVEILRRLIDDPVKKEALSTISAEEIRQNMNTRIVDNYFKDLPPNPAEIVAAEEFVTKLKQGGDNVIVIDSLSAYDDDEDSVLAITFDTFFTNVWKAIKELFTIRVVVTIVDGTIESCYKSKIVLPVEVLLVDRDIETFSDDDMMHDSDGYPFYSEHVIGELDDKVVAMFFEQHEEKLTRSNKTM